jgi:N-methylhydantoinase A
MALIRQFSLDYGHRFGKGSEAPEAGIRINTVRVASYSRMPPLKLTEVLPTEADLKNSAEPFLEKDCHFIGSRTPQKTAFYKLGDLEFGAVVPAPAVVLSPSTTFLVEPGWRLKIGRYGSGLFEKLA